MTYPSFVLYVLLIAYFHSIRPHSQPNYNNTTIPLVYCSSSLNHLSHSKLTLITTTTLSIDLT